MEDGIVKEQTYANTKDIVQASILLYTGYGVHRPNGSWGEIMTIYNGQ